MEKPAAPVLERIHDRAGGSGSVQFERALPRQRDLAQEVQPAGAA